MVVGKPSDFVLAAISDAVGVPRDRMCMIGDRLDTDILFGQQGGLSSMLVLSGERACPGLHASAVPCLPPTRAATAQG